VYVEAKLRVVGKPPVEFGKGDREDFES